MIVISYYTHSDRLFNRLSIPFRQDRSQNRAELVDDAAAKAPAFGHILRGIESGVSTSSGLAVGVIATIDSSPRQIYTRLPSTPAVAKVAVLSVALLQLKQEILSCSSSSGSKRW